MLPAGAHVSPPSAEYKTSISEIYCLLFVLTSTGYASPTDHISAPFGESTSTVGRSPVVAETATASPLVSSLLNDCTS